MKRRARGSGSIYFDKARKRWTAVVSAGYNPATGQRVRLTRHTATQREAIKALSELESLATRKNGTNISSETLLTDWVKRYIDVYKAPHVNPQSLKTYYAHKSIMDKAAQNLRLKNISNLSMQELINRLANDYSAYTVHSVLSLILSALNAAYDDGIITRVPQVKKLSVPRKKSQRRAVSDSEFFAIREQSKNMLFGYLPLILNIARYMGLRRSEILGMTWDDLDIKAGLYKVRYQLGFEKKLAPPKSDAGERLIPVPIPIANELKALRKKQVIDAVRIGNGKPTLIFTTPSYQAINQSSLSNAFARATKAAGVNGVVFHSLRHSYATDMASRVDVKTLQHLLGHASADISLNLYAESKTEHIINAICPMADT